MQGERSARGAGAVAVAVAVAVALAVPGCTTARQDRALPAPSATAVPSAAPATDCVNPRYEFTPAVEQETLTYLTPAVTLTAPDGGALDLPGALPVRTLTASTVSSAGEADARRAYQAFVRQSPTPGLPEFGRELEPYGKNPVTGVGHSGRFVGFAFNWGITSSYVRHCEGAAPGQQDVSGTVTTFRPRFPVALVVDCAEPRGETQRQAARLGCAANV
ncbi:hypothetical protein KCH_05240 [Kitasatospora cheerisanensis KCTC 2395]|uniref:Uncharacterized protein n=1 Tax=Kitasatospora cheerisanensis KCTC 2395 TaxID=1348663 RepID=A0A066Z2Z0_9ACTN|nr:hypothetical protein KCH_05240 [Kitasatospora cheerisanensis KCTC 2395]